MRGGTFLPSPLCWPGMSMLVELSLSRSQPRARSRKDANQQRWAAFKILGSSLISARYSTWKVFQLLRASVPQPWDQHRFIFFLSGMLWEWNLLLKCQDWGAAATRIPSIGRFFLHLSEPQMYSFELFITCDKYSASVLIWLHLRISKHWENFNDLGDTVPALIKINTNTPFGAVVTQSCHRLYNTLRRKVYISWFFQSKNNMAFLRSDRSELEVPAVRSGSSWPKKAKFS